MELAIGDLVVQRGIVTHPLLGDAHVIEYGGHAITAMSVIDWDRPTEIPTIAEPGRLPPGSGALLLNAIAERALAAGVLALRYAGPYPTPALYRALLRSFRTTATEAEFTADVLGRASRLARDPLPFEFTPAPHVRITNEHGFVELRDGLERAVLDGLTAAFERAGSPGRLVELATDLHCRFACELWFGDAPYARIAELSPTGELITGPHPPPTLVSTVIGHAFPPQLRAALAELVADAVPPPLAADARMAVSERSIAWADLGGRTARRTSTGFEVHAVLWERIAPLGLARLTRTRRGARAGRDLRARHHARRPRRGLTIAQTEHRQRDVARDPERPGKEVELPAPELAGERQLSACSRARSTRCCSTSSRCTCSSRQLQRWHRRRRRTSATS